MNDFMTELWLLMRWISEVIVTSDIKNEWYYQMPDDAREFLYAVGQNLVALFG